MTNAVLLYLRVGKADKKHWLGCQK